MLKELECSLTFIEKYAMFVMFREIINFFRFSTGNTKYAIPLIHPTVNTTYP